VAVELAEVGLQVEVVVYELKSVIVVGGAAVGGGRWERGCREYGAIVEMLRVLLKAKDPAMQRAGPFAVVGLLPSAVVRCVWREQAEMYLKDWPQRRVVLMHSSVRLTGSFFQASRPIVGT
jgi:hypothetical protein